MANIELDGANKKIKVDSGDLTLDIPGDIILDADGANVTFKDGGTSILDISNSSSDAVITSSVQDKDIIFKGDDGGSAITALTLDMSDAGAATFNGAITGGGLLTTGGNIVIPNAGNIGSASDTDAIAIASNGVTTFSQAPVFPDGSLALADLDIDGGTDIGADLVDADEIIVDDGGGGTNRRCDMSRVKTYIGAGPAIVASQWRLTTSFDGDADPIASNLEVNDSTGYGSLGSAMSESSGIFTFPSTGIWLVRFHGALQTSGNTVGRAAYNIEVTTDNSTYTEVTNPAVFGATTSDANGYMGVSSETIIDVTNTTNVKVQFTVNQVTNDNNATQGSSSANLTSMLFIRLGDT